MSEGHTLSPGAVRLITYGAKQCAICGSPHVYRPTVDHVIPLAVIKWSDVSECYAQELYDEFNCKSNLVPVCEICNKTKGSYIPTERDINNLFISNDQKKELKKLMEKHSDIIGKYNSIHTELYKKYNGVCQCGCRRLCHISNVAIMRIDNSKGRYLDNAVIIHNNHCNRFSRLKRIIKNKS